MVASKTTSPPPPTWNARERSAWNIPPDQRPSEWAEGNMRLHRGQRKGPWRNDNAPYLRGIMDCPTRPGCVQSNLRKAGQVGGSAATRAMIGFWAVTEPDPMGLTLPNRDKGRAVCTSEILPLFRRTPGLRDLVGSRARDTLVESIRLLNGFSMDLMWSGSSASMASFAYRRVVNDETDKFMPWTGEEPDAIAATEVRLTSYGDSRLQVNISTPTTTAGTIHRLFEGSSYKLHFHVPCPHCGAYEPLRWPRLRWLDAELTAESIAAAEAALAAGQTRYVAGGSPALFAGIGELAAHLDWLRSFAARLEQIHSRRALGGLLAIERDRALWYQCEHCEGRIYDRDKAPMIRRGRWCTVDRPLVDAYGEIHVDAERLERWPHETSLGFTISALYCLWMHWGTLAREWLGVQDDPAGLFFFITNRLGEPYEFRARRLPGELFAAKCATERGAIPAGLVPRWGALLLATVDTQQDGFWVVARAWGAAMRSARVWHGQVATFDELDQLLVKQWPRETDEFGPLRLYRMLIDSGGTADRLLDKTRTQQVYDYALPRQPLVTVIKGSPRLDDGRMYAPMRNPMHESAKAAAEAGGAKLEALLVNTHWANDLLGDLVLRGVPGKDGRPRTGPDGKPERECWHLNLPDDPVYDAHMAAMVKIIDPADKTEHWAATPPGARHDLRDCEAYQIVAAYVAHVSQLPEESELLVLMAAQWARERAEAAAAAARQQTVGLERSEDSTWIPRPL
ncbi:MAG TPA: terminase gpA endonuclease subunit [Phycisphaerae bacterium]|nr:terminase gpA endonuclease subunit [Phycisphaerae bacterium]